MIERVSDGSTVVHDFDSSAELADDAGSLRSAFGHRSDWYGETWDDAVAAARTGRDLGVREAEALLDAVYRELPSLRRAWSPSPAGAYAVVPELLAGMPAHMRRRVEERDCRAPLSAWVDLTSSADVGAEDLRRRGVAWLALAMALGAERAVELRGCAVLGHTPTAIVTWRIETQPLDLSVACNALASTGLVRGLAYEHLRNRCFTGGHWGWGLVPGDAYLVKLRAALGAGEDDLVGGPTFSTDEAIKDPAAFVRREVVRRLGDDA